MGKSANKLQIPLLTDVVEHGEQLEAESEAEDMDEITQPHDEPPISRAEINTIVLSTLARYLVLAGKEISEKLHRQMKKKIQDPD